MSRKLLVLGVVLALLLGSAPITGSAQEQITLRFADYLAAGDHVADLDAVIAAFEAENPTIKIDATVTPFGDYFTLLQADFVGGDPPDIIELNYENFVTYASDNVLLDLTPYVDPAVPFYPRALSAFQYDSKQLALPVSFSTVLLFYNKNLFDQAGIDYPAPDWTWADAKEAALKISALGDDIWGINAPVQFWEFYKRAAQNGCEFFNSDKTESLINSPACVEALDVMVGLITSDAMPDPAEFGGLSSADMFLNGQLGMELTGMWMFPVFDGAPFEWDVQLEPGLAQRGYHFFADSIAIAKNTKHPEAAAAFAQFMASSEAVVKIRLESNWSLPALNDPALFASYLALTPPDNRQAIFDSLEAPVVPPTIVRQSEMQDIVNEQLNAVVAGDLDSQTALNMAKEQIDPLLK